jgi:hydroxypyruvate isomerase
MGHGDRIDHRTVAEIPGRNEQGMGEPHVANGFEAVAEAGDEGNAGFEFTPKREDDAAIEHPVESF